MLADLLVRPDRFFARRAENPSLRSPALLILLLGLTNALVALVPPLLLDVPRRVALAGGLLGAFTAVPVAFVLWGIYALALYGISTLFDGDGDPSTTAALVGWGFAPAVFSALASAVLMALVVDDLMGASAPTVGQMYLNNPLLILMAVVPLLFTLWQGVLWVFALKHARNLSTRAAALAVAVPLVVSMLWSVNGMVP